MRKKDSAINGHALVMDFQTAQMLLGTIYTAEFQAKQTENDILTKFSSYKHSGSVYVSPDDLPLHENTNLIQDSLNSHLQKVQSEQIKEHGLQTIHDLAINANSLYMNKRVKIHVLSKNIKPIHNNWINKHTGQQYFGTNKSTTISGKITEINLSSNYIVLYPGLMRKFVNSLLIGYVIEVISSEINQPIVSIEFI